MASSSNAADMVAVAAAAAEVMEAGDAGTAGDAAVTIGNGVATLPSGIAVDE